MAETIIINGKHLVLLGMGGNAGDRNGVATINVPVAVPDLAAAFALSASDVAAAVGIEGLHCTDRPLSQLEHGGFQINFQFEGFQGEVSEEEGQEKCSYSFDTDMAEEPIETHPSFTYFKETYGPMVDGKFPETYTPKGRRGGSPYSRAKGKTGEQPNPLSGVESWLKVGGVFTRSWAASQVPPSIFDDVGTLVSYPPGAGELNIPKFARRVWLKLSPNVQTGSRGSGSAIRITERYRLTGITSGSESIIYASGQLT